MSDTGWDEMAATPGDWYRTVLPADEFDRLVAELDEPPRPLPRLVETVRRVNENPVFVRRP